MDIGEQKRLAIVGVQAVVRKNDASNGGPQNLRRWDLFGGGRKAKRLS